jgi:hypothetical protein
MVIQFYSAIPICCGCSRDERALSHLPQRPLSWLALVTERFPTWQLKKKKLYIFQTQLRRTINVIWTKLRGFSPQANYRPSDRSLSAKLVPTLADRGCRVVSATDPHGRNLGYLDPKPLLLISSNSSTILTRLSEPRFRPTTSQKIW